MLCYDYRTLEFDASLLKEYREINVIGWSMGVWAATQVMGKLQETDTALVIKNSIAINGTPILLMIHTAFRLQSITEPWKV